MNFRFNHNSINVFDLEKSLAFYQKALKLQEIRRYSPVDASFTLVFLGDGSGPHSLELTWMRDRREPYNLGDNEMHLCLTTSDYQGAYALHKEMNCICYENPAMGLYFIADPDGYWIEIIPEKDRKLPKKMNA